MEEWSRVWAEEFVAQLTKAQPHLHKLLYTYCRPACKYTHTCIEAQTQSQIPTVTLVKYASLLLLSPNYFTYPMNQHLENHHCLHYCGTTESLNYKSTYHTEYNSWAVDLCMSKSPQLTWLWLQAYCCKASFLSFKIIGKMQNMRYRFRYNFFKP